ncbi:MAG: CHAT domain-containing protein [Bacteroidia bacterium]
MVSSILPVMLCSTMKTIVLVISLSVLILAGGLPSLFVSGRPYGLELNAEMVVLSACNTASGKLLSGEGVASLNQGFAYAGQKPDYNPFERG